VSDSSRETTVIVGAGHAGGVLASSLHQNKYAGRVILLGEESHLPYQRPPLSKAFLAGDVELKSLFLKPQETYDKAGIELHHNTRVSKIDRDAKSLKFEDGSDLAYDKLALTTGGRVRRLDLPGGDLPGVYYLRQIDDVIALQPQFKSGTRLVIVGGGYIGLEVAAVAVKRGLEVTVLEAEERVLARVTAPELSEFYEQVHTDAGVTVRTSTQVTGFEGDKQVEAVVCNDGRSIPADMVLIGVGLIPNTELAADAGLDVDNGIFVDDHMRTSDPDIYAAGDCANQHNELLGRRIRLESVPNAMGQARAAAASISGQDKPYQALPWFWSDQYDLKLQMAGISQGYDQIVIRGSMQERSFAAFYLKDGVIIAVDAVSRPPEFMVGKRLITNQAKITPERLADESIDMKSID